MGFRNDMLIPVQSRNPPLPPHMIQKMSSLQEGLTTAPGPPPHITLHTSHQKHDTTHIILHTSHHIQHTTLSLLEQHLVTEVIPLNFILSRQHLHFQKHPA